MWPSMPARTLPLLECPVLLVGLTLGCLLAAAPRDAIDHAGFLARGSARGAVEAAIRSEHRGWSAEPPLVVPQGGQHAHLIGRAALEDGVGGVLHTGTTVCG
jgi:hypothetical protein